MITSVTLARGAVVMARKKVIVKHLSAIQNFGSIDVLCSDKTGTLTKGDMVLDRSVDPFGSPSNRVLALAWVNSKFETDIKSRLDLAICKLPCPTSDEFEKCDEIPFDFDRRRVSIVVRGGPGQTLTTKGSPEGIFPLVSAYERNGKILPVDAVVVAEFRETYENLSGAGFRFQTVVFGRLSNVVL
jgi:Mg2+-importing ATPase